MQNKCQIAALLIARGSKYTMMMIFFQLLFSQSLCFYCNKWIKVQRHFVKAVEKKGETVGFDCRWLYGIAVASVPD